MHETMSLSYFRKPYHGSVIITSTYNWNTGSWQHNCSRYPI